MNIVLYVILVLGAVGIGFYAGGKKNGFGLSLYGSALLYFVYLIASSMV